MPNNNPIDETHEYLNKVESKLWDTNQQLYAERKKLIAHYAIDNGSYKWKMHDYDITVSCNYLYEFIKQLTTSNIWERIVQIENELSTNDKRQEVITKVHQPLYAVVHCKDCGNTMDDCTCE